MAVTSLEFNKAKMRLFCKSRIQKLCHWAEFGSVLGYCGIDTLVSPVSRVTRYSEWWAFNYYNQPCLWARLVRLQVYNQGRLAKWTSEASASHPEAHRWLWRLIADRQLKSVFLFRLWFWRLQQCWRVIKNWKLKSEIVKQIKIAKRRLRSLN